MPQISPKVRHFTLTAHVLLVAAIVLALRVAAILYWYFSGQAWRITLGLALIASAACWHAEAIDRAVGADGPGARAALGLAGIAVTTGRPIGRRRRRGGFTLVELLVVITIIVIVSAVALPTVLPALEQRQASEAARLLQATIAGARDRAIRDGRPSGFRLIPDPAWPIRRLPNGQVDPSQPLACSTILPIGPAPDHADGLVNVFPSASYPAAILTVNGFAGCPCLVVEEAATDDVGAPNPPTAWFWNIRIGDRIRIREAGAWYSVVGPMVVPNAEGFVNAGQPGAPPPTLNGGSPCEYLLLVNGWDDNRNGWVDEGFDGVDNDGVHGVDEHEPGTFAKVGRAEVPCDEWEAEAWIGAESSGVSNAPYTIRRRPAPLPGARALSLPTQVVIDLTTWSGRRERSRLPVDPWTGQVDLMIRPDGSVVPTLLYGVPSSSGMDAAFRHFWLADRGDVRTPTASSGLPAPEGSCRLLTLAARTGRTVVTDDPDPASAFAAAQQGSW